MKKVVILIGNYGSGKTEIALNMAVKAAAEGKRRSSTLTASTTISACPTTSDCSTTRRSI